MPTKPLHIWIVSENASLRMGGEAAIPFRFFRELRKLGHKVTLLTHGRVKDELTKSLSSEELADVVFFPDSAFQRYVFKAGRWLPHSLQESYVSALIRLQTEYRQRQYLLKHVSPGGRDIVFQPTPISPKGLTLTDVPNVPVFFGPLNGAMSYPSAFRDRESKLNHLLTRIGRIMSEPLNRFFFKAKSKAAGIFVSNPRTVESLPSCVRMTPIFKSYDATIDATHWQSAKRAEDIEPNHFMFVGRLVSLKAVEIAIKAVHRLDGKARLTIVGDGPERQSLEALAKEGPGTIDFTGFLSHADILQLYERVTALAFPSLHEAGGNVCMEALACGVPVIAVKWGGPCDVVIDGVDGFLIEPDGEEALVDGFAKAMLTLINDAARVRAMGDSGRSRVLTHFDWGQKALDYTEIFLRALDAPTGKAVRFVLQEAHPGHSAGPAVNIAWP